MSGIRTHDFSSTDYIILYPTTIWSRPLHHAHNKYEKIYWNEKETNAHWN